MLQVQLCEQVVELHNGKVTSTFDCGVSASVLPSLRRLSPAAPLLVSGDSAVIELEATYLPHEATILCRSRGVLMTMLQWRCATAASWMVTCTKQAGRAACHPHCCMGEPQSGVAIDTVFCRALPSGSGDSCTFGQRQAAGHHQAACRGLAAWPADGMQCFNHRRHLTLSHIPCGPDMHSAEGLVRSPDARLCHAQIELAMGATVLWPMRLLVAPSADVAREMERLPSDMTGASTP